MFFLVVCVFWVFLLFAVLVWVGFLLSLGFFNMFLHMSLKHDWLYFRFWGLASDHTVTINVSYSVPGL